MSTLSQPVVAVIQARMTSTRLPGKVLMEVAGRPLLSWQLDQVRRARSLDRIVVATTALSTDDPVVALCESEGCGVVRGDESDVLSRFVLAARQFHAQTVVRLTADCPLLDPSVIDTAVDRFLQTGCDYLSNMLPPTYPYGMAVEVMKAEALFAADAEATTSQEREHVTPFIYWHPERFRLESLVMTPDLSHHRWTVDTPEDFELVSRILPALGDTGRGFGLADVLGLLEQHPDWGKINAHVEQKAVSRGRQDDS